MAPTSARRIHSPRPALAIAALLLALAAVAPFAAADHAFSHRVHVVGRVVDGDGAPVAGRAVAVEFLGLQVGGRCFDSRDEVTGPQGDFSVCRHAHAMPPGGDVAVTVTAEGTSVTVPFDTDVRQAEAYLRLPGPAPPYDLNGWRAFNRTFHVEGRLFQVLEAPEEVEGVPVTAEPRGGANVTVELLDGETTLVAANATTDAEGRYAADLAVEDVPAGARVRVRAGEMQAAEAADATLRRADVHLVRGAAMDPLLSDPERPGTSTPRIPAPAWTAPVALALAALALTAAAATRPRRR